jgi:acyl-CoA synthetase (AMP-forming)/AMP-acid ligase II
MTRASGGRFQFTPAPTRPELQKFYISQGFMPTISLQTLMIRNQQEFPTLPAVIDGDVTLSWATLIDLAARFGGFLQANGIRAGDVVMWQLPNWWEALVVAYGVWAAGAISAGIVPIYREHEVAQMYRATSPRCIIMPHDFRGVDHLALAAAAGEAEGFMPDLKVSVRGSASGWIDFDHSLTAAPYICQDVDVNDPAVVAMTSGTTSGAKFVVHSSATFISNPSMMTRLSSYGWRDRAYMPAPLAHATGLLTAVGVPSFTGCSIVLRDRWDAELAIDDITSHGVTFSSGGAIFIRELLDALETRGLQQLPMSSGYPCGGGNIATELAMRADAAGIHPARSYGMTECPGAAYGAPFEPPDVRCGADGRVSPGFEVRVVNESGTDLPSGDIGEFMLRGPSRALGYIAAEHTREAFDSDGWYRTGDMGLVADDNVLTVTGRIKEIINRGGEKISAREIEDLLMTHPLIVEAAVVPAPHSRLGEQPAAFIIARDRDALSTVDLRDYLLRAGLAPQKIPGLWTVVDSLPRTSLGKVRKYILQQQLADK